MTTQKGPYIVSLYLKTNKEEPAMVVWKEEEEPALSDIMKKTIAECVNNRLTNELLDNPASVVVRKMDEEYNMNEVASYILDKETLKKEFFQYIKMDL